MVQQNMDKSFTTQVDQKLKEINQQLKNFYEVIDLDKQEEDVLNELRRAIEGKTLDSKSFVAYKAAEQKVKSEFKKFREVNKFIADRAFIHFIIDGAIKYPVPSSDGARENYKMSEMDMFDFFNRLNQFIDDNHEFSEESSKILTPAVVLQAKNEAIDVRVDLARTIVKRFETFSKNNEDIKSGLKDLLSRAKSGATNISLKEYTDFLNKIRKQDDVLKHYKDLLSKNTASRIGKAFEVLQNGIKDSLEKEELTLNYLHAILPEGKEFMNSNDRFVLENNERAELAVVRGAEKAKEWEDAAKSRQRMLLAKQTAKQFSDEILAKNGDVAMFKEAQKFMKAAEGMETKSFTESANLYAKAEDFFKKALSANAPTERVKTAKGQDSAVQNEVEEKRSRKKT